MRRSLITLALLPLLPLLAAGCGGDPVDRTLLRDGCYLDEETHLPVLRVNGEHAVVLVPNDVGTLTLTPRRGRDGNYVEIRPGFTVETPVTRVKRIGPELHTTRFKLQPGAGGPTIMANMDAYGETPLVFGPCPAAPANPPAR
jgi:hypothetical protein